MRDDDYAEVLLNTEDAWYPLAIDGEIIYPTGRFRTRLTRVMVDMAELRGHLVGEPAWAVVDKRVAGDIDRVMGWVTTDGTVVPPEMEYL